MLKRLDISNYALIDNVNLKFNSGFTSITGETGAGKSILLKALNLLLGERADTSVLKQSNQKCFLEAEFEIGYLNLEGFFSQHDLDFEKDSIIRREFSASGKSRCFINDSPVQLSTLKSLGEKLISLHSQHQTLDIFSNSFQVEAIDHFAGIELQSKAFRKSYRSFTKKVSELAELKLKDAEARKEKDYLEFLIAELEIADLDNLDLDKLISDFDKVENSEKISGGIQYSQSIFDNETYGPLTGIKSLIESFEELKNYDPRFADVLSRLLSVKIEMDDIDNEIQNYSGEFDLSQGEILAIKEKMELLNSLCFKHNLNEVQDLIDLKNKLNEQLFGINNLELSIQSLETTLEKLKIDLYKEAKLISEKRNKSITPFVETINELLSNLAMEDAQIQVQIEQSENVHLNGLDELQILFKTNLGGQFMPIKKVASGGELSRLMMAILSTLSESKKLPTLIFDEIDTGVSGEVAAKIANQFKKMSSKIQIIAITHLAQVAGAAENHLHVSKSNQEDKTITNVLELSGESRINELAKMLSGENITEAAKENALHLLKSS